MTTKLRMSLEGCVNSTLHSIPAEINYDGEANVSRYFNIRPTNSEEPGEWKSSFRGRPLSGKEVDIPSGYQGLVVNKKRDTFSDQQDQTLHVEKTFNKFMCWNLETPPTSHDVLLKTFDWLQVANVVHTPLNVDDEEDGVKSSPDER